MSGQFLHEHFRPVGLPELHDIGQRVMNRLADDLLAYFPEARVSGDVAGQVDTLLANHPEALDLRRRHQLVLEWLRQRCV